MDQLKQFGRMNPGKRFKMVLYSNEKKSSHLGYYFAEIVPKFKQAFRELGEPLSDTEVDQRLRDFSPVLKRQDETGSDVIRSLSDDDFSDDDWKEYIEDLKIFGASNFNIVINQKQMQ